MKPQMSILRSLVVLVGLPVFLPALPAAQDQPAALVEQGRFTLHKFEQPIGHETYEITREAGSLRTKMDFQFTDRGTTVPLTATFLSATDLTPQSFEIKGRTSRLTPIDEAMDVRPREIRFRDQNRRSEVPRPDSFFTIAGYAPTTMQMLMVRYWATHGSPPMLPIPPNRVVRVEPRGQDDIEVKGKVEKLSRYTIEGLIWGRETLWFDRNHNLIAAVTLDAEFDHFEAIREGYEGALAEFVRRAGMDGMQSLAEASKTIPRSRATTLALVGGTLIDGTGKPALADAAVVVRDGRIISAGPRSQVQIPADATLVDARGKVVMAGLWDMHAHFEQVEWGPIYLAAGVTTVRDCANEFEFITAVRDAIAQGRGLGPRILAAGVVDGSGPLTVGVERVDTPEQARAWTDRYHDAGFQQMKIYSSMKLEEVHAVAEEAHRLGMTVTGHVPEGLNAYQTVEAGQDQINHIEYILDMMHPPFPAVMTRPERREALAAIDLNSADAQKAISFLKEHHTVVDPTLALYEFMTADTAKPPASFEPGVLKVAPELEAQLADVGPPTPDSEIRGKLFQKEVEVVGALHRAGVPMVAGTDQTVPGHSLHREIELYVQAGFTPMEAIQAATLVPAQAMGLSREVGTVEAGKRADLIILRGNPLDDIHNTRKVEYVITNGKMYHTAELWQSVGFQP